jgi:hypothetical protein
VIARPSGSGEDDAVRRVEARDDLAAGEPERQRHLAVDPDLGVVVDHHLEHDGGAGGIE